VAFKVAPVMTTAIWHLASSAADNHTAVGVQGLAADVAAVLTGQAVQFVYKFPDACAMSAISTKHQPQHRHTTSTAKTYSSTCNFLHSL
jgi:hypothetical protein